MSFIKTKRLLTHAILITLGSAGSIFAQQRPETPGMVRISSPKTSSLIKPAGNQSVQQVGGHRMVHGGSCPTGNCPPAAVYDAGSCPTGNCPPSAGCPTGHCHGGCFGGFCGDYYCKHSPDYGYGPPAKWPLQRRGVEYTHYYPQQWYGAGADYSGSYAPMVYQPTDTTQLGYKYQHVPFWQPMPNRLPPRPIPAQWHITPPPVQATSYRPGAHGWHGGYAGMSAGMYGANCPPSSVPVQAQPTPAQQPAVLPQTVPAQAAPVESGVPQPLIQETVPPVQAVPAVQPNPIDSGVSAFDDEEDFSALPPAPGSSSAQKETPASNIQPASATASPRPKSRRF